MPLLSLFQIIKKKIKIRFLFLLKMSSNSHDEEAEKVCSYLIQKINLSKSKIEKDEGQKRHIVTSLYQMLGQLQMKMIDIQTSLRKSTTQIEGLKREIQRSKLTDKEINTLDTNTRMYSSVGRM